MTNPMYNVNISWCPMRPSGQQAIMVNGVTQSFPSYSGGYFVATMQQADISATAADYRTALDNLLILATASTTYDPMVLPYKSTF